MRPNINMCGPECSYRSLFEGSQTSLSDMASKHAQTLSRVGRIRSSAVTIIRKHYPEMASQAEQNFGRRLSDIDDEILLAYLDAFISTSSSHDHSATLRGLREALNAIGVPIIGDDPLSWVEQVHRHRVATREAGMLPSTQAAPAAAAVGNFSKPLSGNVPAALQTDASGQRQSSFDEDPPEWVEEYGVPSYPDPAYLDPDRPTPDMSLTVRDQPLPVEDYWSWTPKEPGASKTLGELFAASAPPLWDGALGETVEETERWTPSPVRPSSELQTGPGAPAAVPPKSDTEAGNPVDEQAEAPATELESASSGGVAHRTQPRTTGELDDQISAGGVVTSEPISKGATVPPDSPAGEEPDPVSPPDSAPTPANLKPEGKAVAEATPVRQRTIVQLPLRPEIIPQQTAPKRGRRAVRTHATPASDLALDVPIAAGELGADLDDQLRQALLAAASIPRPVFSRDLAGVGGSPEAVETWEYECRADPESVPVRFIAPKSRHRLRGPLVVFESPGAVKPSDWWQQCVRKYRAARLYELGVLLHRVGDEVVSFSLSDDAAVFHLDTPRGLVGLVVVFDARLEKGEPTRINLETQLHKLLGERLTLAAVLTTSGERGSLEALTDAARAVLSVNGWSPTAPVIAARSWEYADDRGTSAVMVADAGTT